ncbi:unnamed protein product [Adineta ricciae]|uniref:ADP-ribosylation factor-like protein 6 n=1 Tax=Adineta ricciae TaxID=249248 RepID=A0A814E939_ADIRI|nr:unnamed protein product [Adineta ricciae]
MLGLKDSGKTTILKRLNLGEVVTSIPTADFSMEIMKYKTNTIVSWDLQGKEEQHVRWRPYFRDTAYLILVIDSADYEYINVARDELHQLLSESDLSCAHLLVYANKSDLTNAMSIAKIIDELELDSVKDRRWKVEQTCATTGVGLFEGLEWLTKHSENFE